MRFNRNYFGITKKILAWLISRFKPLTIHTEAIMIDSVWKKIKEKVKSKKVKIWYIMTPVNYDYFKSFLNMKISKKKLSEIMKKRYKWMVQQGERLELHIHLSMAMKTMSFKDQEKLIKEALSWMKKELNLKAREFVPGWWAYNRDTLEICKKHGLRMIYPKDYDYTHDYHWIL